MGIRIPLKAGTVIRMPNQGKYIIEEKIGEGGLSLVYSAKTMTNGYPVIIKEFFPYGYAQRAVRPVRAADGTILVRKGCVYAEAGSEERFQRCLKAFEQEGQFGSVAHLTSFQVISFADCGDGYAVLPGWSSDTCSLEDLVNGWLESPPGAIDPVFSDLGRVRFALVIISSLLTALTSLHEQLHLLHLDISPNNIVWAGQSRTSPQHGTAFLTDFGCSVLLAEGSSFPAEYVLSCSRDYAAPEYQDGKLDCTTDIYAVGRLLAFLCRGHRAFDLHTTPEAEIQRLKIPDRHRQTLSAILKKATAVLMTERYPSARAMQEAVQLLLDAMPLHPINENNTDAFTLYSLKFLMEGSRATHYSWANELCDRRGVSIDIPEFACCPIASIPSGRFLDDRRFLQTTLPEEIFDYLQKKINASPDPRQTLGQIMSGNYPDLWKRELSSMFMNYGLNRLFAICRSLLTAERAFDTDINLLFHLPGDDIDYFQRCVLECSGGDRSKGLALLVLFALLGKGEFGFAHLARHSPSELRRMFDQ